MYLVKSASSKFSARCRHTWNENQTKLPIHNEIITKTIVYKLKMNVNKIKIEEIFDVLIHRHSFDENNRDYLFQIETNWIDNNHGNYILRFKNCFELQCELNSTDFKNIDWSGTSVMAYPGFQEVKDSKKANELSKKVGMELKEIILETALYKLNLVTSDFDLKKLNSDSKFIDRISFKIE